MRRRGKFKEGNSVGNSKYSGVGVKADKDFSHGLQLLASYAYSKALDYNSPSSAESLVLQNPYNPRGDYGLSEYDVRNRFVLSGVYELPFKAIRLFSPQHYPTLAHSQTCIPLTPPTPI